jgi:transposase
MLEHHQRLLSAQQQRIAELDWQIARESHYDGSKVAKGLGPTTFASLEREAIDWNRFQNRKQIGSYIACCPSEFSTGNKQKLGSIDSAGQPAHAHSAGGSGLALKEMEPHLAGL